MAPSAVPDGDSADAALQKREDQITMNGIEQNKDIPKSEPEKSKPNKDKTVNGLPKAPQTGEGQKEGKLSGKELKEKAKAEKAAKRAKEKQGRQGQPVADLQGGNQTGDKPRRQATPSRAPVPASGTQHRRTGSTNAKSLPIRPAEAQAVNQPLEPKKEDKKVALFDHLYGHPRRTSIAGAGKDVHPAVLALGLQMSNYVICGSNARCVATLLVFQKVHPYPPKHSRPILLSTGNRNLHNPSLHLPPSPPNHSPLNPNRLPRLLPPPLNQHGKRHPLAQSFNLRDRRQHP